MTMGIRGKLFLVSMGLIASALMVSDLFLTSSLDRNLTDRMSADLGVRAGLAEQTISQEAQTLKPNADRKWQELAVELGLRSKARITVISLDGKVLGDSGLDEKGLANVENHKERPEVKEALTRGHGTSIRYSTTVEQRMMYVAVPFFHQGGQAGVVRIALPLSQVDRAVKDLRKILVVASLLALGVAGLIATLATRRISRTLRQLAETAGRMVSGELGERTHTAGHDEIATLGKSLDHLAANLSKTLDQLRTERDLLGDILGGMQEGVLVLDAKSRVIHANPALRAMLLLGADIISKPLLDVIRNADLVEILGEARENKTTATGEVELSGIKPKRLLVQAAPLQGDTGNLLMVLVDVTQLRQLESIRKDFVANASHELRTPVASLRSAAETLRGAMNDPEASLMFLEMIERNAGRLHQLVEDLLDLSRIESKEFRLQMEDLNLTAFADQMVHAYARLAQDKAIQMEVISAAPGIMARADRRALEQVVGNLLDNAIKYCPSAAKIQIQVETQGERCRISVSDTGPGIPPQHLPRLFERFYRVDASRSRELGGTGLGLAIVKHLVEAMRGTVTVESDPGKGSTFSFTLPKAIS
ncbi:MAG: ATP-binding protein [Holophaga sp.]|nr:ATP-binding protein [Holophaga sp.]